MNKLCMHNKKSTQTAQPVQTRAITKCDISTTLIDRYKNINS